ncbi:MAG: GTP-binding protein [Candidatus Helarchaeota archaeon]
MSQDKYDYLLKCIVVGDAAVGKTALSLRFAEGIFRDDYKVTIGVDFSIKMMNVYGFRVKLQVWDTGGQEQFSYIRPLYYTGASCGFIVFDKTKRVSFDHIGKWVREVNVNRGNIPLILIGNKDDLPDQKVTTEEGKKLANNLGIIYFDTSAKSGKSVDLVFKTLVRMVLDPKFLEKLKIAQSKLEQPQLIYDGSYEKYNTFANRASACFQAGNKLESLFSLEKALHWAQVAKYDDGVKWAQAQIAYITRLLNEDKPIEKKDIILICENCNIYFQVKKDGVFTCPKCYQILKKM